MDATVTTAGAFLARIEARAERERAQRAERAAAMARHPSARRRVPATMPGWHGPDVLDATTGRVLRAR